MPLTNGSGSGSCYFHHWPSRCQQKLIFNTNFSAYYFLKVHLHHFSKIKSLKELQNSRNQGFSYYFCMMIQGSVAGAGSIPLTSGSGSAPLTSGSRSGSGRPKNMWIRWIWIRNTGPEFQSAAGPLLIDVVLVANAGCEFVHWCHSYSQQCPLHCCKHV